MSIINHHTTSTTPNIIHPKKSSKNKCFITLTIISTIIFFFINIIFIMVYMNSMNDNNTYKEYQYRMVYMNMMKNETYEGVIIKNQLLSGYKINDENGVGYVMRIDNDDEKEEEEVEVVYKVTGDCVCCFECMTNDANDENECGEGYFCSEKGKCLKDGSCRNEYDCQGNEYCNKLNGKCVKWCNDDDCGENKICDMNGECMDGCKNDGECKNGEICFLSQCSDTNCRDNWDCNDNDHVCVNNECINYVDDELMKSCFETDDCVDGYYCDYEYLICVNNKYGKETLIDENRRNVDVLPVLQCLLPSVLSLFIVATSSLVVSNIAKKELKDKCNEECYAQYFSSYNKVDKVDIEVTKEYLKKYGKRIDSECDGKCKLSVQVKNPLAINYAQNNCDNVVFKSIVTAEDKVYYFKNIDITRTSHISLARNVFIKELREYCKSFRFSYWYTFKGARSIRNIRVCVADLETIKCEEIYPYGERF